MAYRQQYQPGPAPAQNPYQYDRGNDQRGWRDERGQASYPHGNQRPYEAPQGRNGYGGLAAPDDQNGHWQNQNQNQNQYDQNYWQDSYNQGPGNGYSNGDVGDPYDQGHSSGRQYQYDERYRNNNNGPARQPQGTNYFNESEPPRGGRSQPDSARKTARERILQQPGSPKSLAWDNPFGVFPPKSKKSGADGSKRGSLDKGMAGLDIIDRPASAGGRPSTSHGQRGDSRREDARPNTSHGRNGESGRGTPQGYPMPPQGRISPETTRRGPSAGPPGRMGAPPDMPQMDSSRRGGPSPGSQGQRGPGGYGGLGDYNNAPMDAGPPRAGPLSRTQTFEDRNLPHGDPNLRPGNFARAHTFDSQSRSSPSQETQRPGGYGGMGDYNSRDPPRPSGEDRRRPGPYGGMSDIDPVGVGFPHSSQDRPKPGGYGGLGDSNNLTSPPTSDPDRQRSGTGYGGMGGHNGGNLHAPSRDHYGLDEGYQRDHIPQSTAYHSPIDPRGPSNQESYNTGGYRAMPAAGSNGHNNVRSTEPQQPEMPNFDAIPQSANERPESHIGSHSTQQEPYKAYQKPTYQAAGAYTHNLNTTQSAPQASNAVSSPLDDFHFDLPSNGPIAPSRNDGYGSQGQSDQRGGYGDLGGYGQGSANGYGNGQQGDGSGFPPRSASRNGMKPQPGPAPPVPGNQPYRSFSQENYQPGPGGRGPGGPSGYDQGAPYDQADPRQGPTQGGRPFDQGFNQSSGGLAGRGLHGQGPAQRGVGPEPRNGGPQAQPGPGLQGPPRPATSNSAHPIPVRHYGDTRAVSDNQGRGSNDFNPDALPAHPTPARQGLKGNNSSQSLSNGVPKSQTPPQPGNGRVSPPVTLNEITTLRNTFSANPSDHALGLKLAKRLVEAAAVLSSENGAADPKRTQKNRENYIFEGHKVVKRLVAANYAEAMFYLADCHGQGLLGLPVDPKEAFLLYQSAAKLNHPQSAYRVAVCCELGNEEGGGTRRDPMKAIQWYKRAATLGDTPAMYKMGMILLKGLLGQQKNSREAVSWLKRAAERADRDNPHALHELGLLYENPAYGGADHMVRDERYALSLFQQAAELGYKYSQFRMGCAYEFGQLGAPIDARQSIAWYTRAASQGEHQSELALSGWYLTGAEPLLSQSDTEAFLWARKAASSGLAKAEYAMGYFCEVGIGMAGAGGRAGGDIEEAKRWYYRAAAQNFGKARERLEELKRGGQQMRKTRVRRSDVNRRSEGECTVM